MVQDPLLECSFLIPVSRDSNLADGGKHQPLLWDWIENELHDRFGGLTLAPGTQQGSYIDPDTQQRIVDESVKFTVAVSESRIQELRRLLSAVCVLFEQKCIYLSIAGHVEFIGPP
jgi:hypothetical protein